MTAAELIQPTSSARIFDEDRQRCAYMGIDANGNVGFQWVPYARSSESFNPPETLPFVGSEEEWRNKLHPKSISGPVPISWFALFAYFLDHENDAADWT